MDIRNNQWNNKLHSFGNGQKDLGFDEALNEAKLHGYAEQDPTLDIDGHDSAHKISLLASLAFGTIFDFDEIPARGIRGIDKRDVRFAKNLAIK